MQKFFHQNYITSPICAFIISFFVNFFIPQDSLANNNNKEYTIAIVRDGDSWYFDRNVSLFLKELNSMASSNYTIRIKDEFNAQYDANQVSNLLIEALADSNVDIVYTAGIIATERAARLPDEKRTKPIMGGALQFTDARGQPISEDGTSNLKNYTFITNPQRVAADLELIKRLTNTPKIHALIEKSILPELVNIDKAKANMQKNLGVSIEFIAAENSASAILKSLPENITAMYVSVLPQINNAERENLYSGLAKKGIPTVTMLGEYDVKLGAMAGLAPQNQNAVARRTALNIHQLLQGISTTNLPVYLPVQDHLVINALTAKETQWYPDYKTELEAEFINEEIFYEGNKMNLVESMEIAAKNNSDVLISVEEETIQHENSAISKSVLLPQISATGSHTHTDFSDRINPVTTPRYLSQGSYGAQIRQILFNDEFRSNFHAQKERALGIEFDTISKRHDAKESAAVAYFSYLTTKALYEIEKENLRLTENNYQLAKLRVEIGAAEPSEIYRWQQDRARNKANLFQRDSDRANALVSFNRILGLPRESLWSFVDVNLKSDEFYFMDKYLKPLLQNAKQFQLFGQFLQFFAVENSSELFKFDYEITAQGIILKQKNRQYYFPEIAASAGYNRVIEKSQFTNTDSENRWSAGIEFSIPIFESGQRTHDIRKQKAFIRQLAAQREKAVQQIEERVLAAANEVAATHPNIRFSRQALTASEKNYQSIQEKYSQGAASILDLLDAQSGLLKQRQQASVAVYSHLQAIHRIQRSIAWFEHEKTIEDKNKFADLLKKFLEKSGKLDELNFSSQNELRQK